VYGDALAVQVGRSMWSVPTTATTSASVPDPPPRPMVGAITRSSANFSWQPPKDDGGSPVVLYRVGASWLRAAAVSADACRVTKQAALPSAACVYTMYWASLSIQAAQHCAGCSHTTSCACCLQVDLQAKTKIAVAEMGPDWTTIYQGPTRACTVSQLCPGCGYRVRVCAINAAGPSQYSVPLDFVTAADVPLPPAPPVATATGAYSMEVGWEAPLHNGGSAITHYNLEVCCGLGCVLDDAGVAVVLLLPLCAYTRASGGWHAAGPITDAGARTCTGPCTDPMSCHWVQVRRLSCQCRSKDPKVCGHAPVGEEDQQFINLYR
jgi:hypothetical protein